ncbi:class I SAM-dependent methyltransferase [Patescibacteria group bacterium]|nr:class I SAM-dependent methyltransferase [Patescibacteria group bacterium]
MFTELERRLSIENLEPGDWQIAFSPGLLKEHLARYQYAVDTALAQFPLDQSLTVLDLPCGRGYGTNILNQLRDKLPDSTVIGAELGTDYVKKASRKYGHRNNNSPFFIQADGRRLPLADESVDVITAFEIIEHLPRRDQPRFVEELTGKLNPGGLLLASVPGRYSFTTDKQGQPVRTRPGVTNPHHLYEPTAKETKQYLENAGLEIVEELGQGWVSTSELQTVGRISQTIPPARVIHAWTLPRDMSVRERPSIDTTPLTHVFVARKPK